MKTIHQFLVMSVADLFLPPDSSDDSTMFTFFEKAKQMFGRLRKIFGVGDDLTAAGRMASRRHVRDEQPMYLPESRLTEQQIHGVGDSGDTWVSWRTDAGGESWYRRTSDAVRGVEPEVEIHGIDAADELPETDETQDALQAFRRETGILKSRYERGEIGDLFESGDYDGEGSDDVV